MNVFVYSWTFVTFFVVYKCNPRDFHMSLTTPLSRKSRAKGLNDFDLSGNLKQKKTQNHYLLSAWLQPDTRYFRNSKIYQNCRFLKENNFLSPFLCANNGCKNLLDQDFKKSLCSPYLEKQNSWKNAFKDLQRNKILTSRAWGRTIAKYKPEPG